MLMNFILDNGIGQLSDDWNLAITKAILSDSPILETDPSCSTGNCTFPVFSSVGFCSNCVDITQFLQQNANCAEIEMEDLTLSFLSNRTIKCTYWLPVSGSGLNYSYFDLGDLPADGPLALSWITMSDNRTDTNVYMNAPAFLTRFLVINTPEENSGNFRTPFNLPGGDVIPSPLATIALFKTAPKTGSMSTGFVSTANICALNLCAREYNVSMTSGLLRSEIISTSYSDFTWHPWHPDPENDDLVVPGSSSYRFSFPNSVNNFTFIHNASTYSMESFEVGLNSSLREILEGDLTFNSFSSIEERSKSATSMLQSGLNASSNIPETMDRVAAAMTNRLRDVSSLNVQGQSGSMELYVRVSWLWLVLPILSVFLGTVLLISVITVTGKHQMPIWKTSELALLFHGLDFLLDDTVETRKVSEMEEIAMAMQVKLGHGSGGALKLQRKQE